MNPGPLDLSTTALPNQQVPHGSYINKLTENVSLFTNFVARKYTDIDMNN